MQTSFDINFFIRKYEAVPEEMWLIREFRNGERGCVMGLCDYSSGDRDALGYLFMKYSYLFTPIEEVGNLNVWHEQAINNGDDPKYQQPTAKQRILAALLDIKKEIEKDPEPKTIIRYVAVNEEIREAANKIKI